MNHTNSRWSATCFALFTALCGIAQNSGLPKVAFDGPMRIAGVVPITALESTTGCQLEVRIAVDRDGNVAKAELVWRKGICTNSLIAAAVAQAKEYRFNPDPTAPPLQNGSLTWDVQGDEPVHADHGPTEPVPEEPLEEDWVTFAEPMPQYPGGEEAFKAYLTTNLRYPELEREESIEGTVYLSIIVEPNGAVTNVTVLRGVNGGPGLKQEAIRLLKAMPPWTPGRQNGRPVRVKLNVPVKFRLE